MTKKIIALTLIIISNNATTLCDNKITTTPESGIKKRREIHIIPRQYRKKVTLESPIIEILDGKRWAINGETYGLFL
jgi:hypothetical protein